MATLIRASGTEKEIAPTNKKHFTLKELQGYVGGYIELVETAGSSGSELLVVNEEGLLVGLRPNVRASCLAGVPIVGDAVLCLPREIK